MDIDIEEDEENVRIDALMKQQIAPRRDSHRHHHHAFLPYVEEEDKDNEEEDELPTFQPLVDFMCAMCTQWNTIMTKREALEWKRKQQPPLVRIKNYLQQLTPTERKSILTLEDAYNQIMMQHQTTNTDTLTEEDEKGFIQQWTEYKNRITQSKACVDACTTPHSSSDDPNLYLHQLTFENVWNNPLFHIYQASNHGRVGVEFQRDAFPYLVTPLYACNHSSQCQETAATTTMTKMFDLSQLCTSQLYEECAQSTLLVYQKTFESFASFEQSMPLLGFDDHQIHMLLYTPDSIEWKFNECFANAMNLITANRLNPSTRIRKETACKVLQMYITSMTERYQEEDHKLKEQLEAIWGVQATPAENTSFSLLMCDYLTAHFIIHVLETCCTAWDRILTYCITAQTSLYEVRQRDILDCSQTTSSSSMCSISTTMTMRENVDSFLTSLRKVEKLAMEATAFCSSRRASLKNSKRLSQLTALRETVWNTAANADCYSAILACLTEMKNGMDECKQDNMIVSDKIASVLAQYKSALLANQKYRTSRTIVQKHELQATLDIKHTLLHLSKRGDGKGDTILRYVELLGKASHAMDYLRRQSHLIQAKLTHTPSQESSSITSIEKLDDTEPLIDQTHFLSHTQHALVTYVQKTYLGADIPLRDSQLLTHLQKYLDASSLYISHSKKLTLRKCLLICRLLCSISCILHLID